MDIRDRCTDDQMEVFFERDNNALTYPDMGVKEVFVAVDNPDQAFVMMEFLGEPQAGREGLINDYLMSRPYQIVREEGRWHLAMEMIMLEEGCPFTGGYSVSTPTPAETSTPN